MAHALATTELVQYALGRRREVTGHLLSWRIDTALRTRHAAPRFPDCPHCGPTRPETGIVPVRLGETDAISDVEAGWRALSQEEALRRLETIVSPLTGIVSHRSEAHPEIGRASCRERVCQYV